MNEPGAGKPAVPLCRNAARKKKESQAVHVWDSFF